MSVERRQRTVCQACGAMCKTAPLEIQMRGGNGWRGYWRWSSRSLCPVCKAAHTDFWFALAGREDEGPLTLPHKASKG